MTDKLKNQAPVSSLEALARRHEKALLAGARMREALEKIASPTQTTDLLWWQLEARSALTGGPVRDTETLEASNVCQTCEGTGKEGRHSICRDCDETQPPPSRAVGT